MTKPFFRSCWLGRLAYRQALELQEALAAARAHGTVPDTLLLLEHPETYTLGRRGKEENLLAPREALERLGVEIHRVDRGGDITFHGPGQLVGYPILALENRAREVKLYVANLEETLILALASFGVSAQRLPSHPGVWVGDEKIASIGVRIDARAVTRHGFALNVNTDLTFFRWIVPCGIVGKSVTSLSRVLGRTLPLPEVADLVADCFGKVFRMERVRLDSASEALVPSS